jgi:hypothetical protein
MREILKEVMHKDNRVELKRAGRQLISCAIHWIFYSLGNCEIYYYQWLVKYQKTESKYSQAFSLLFGDSAWDTDITQLLTHCLCG